MYFQQFKDLNFFNFFQGYRRIPIISPGAYFWSKGLSEKTFLGGLIFGGGLYMDKYLRFENAIFYSSNCNFF